MRCVSKINLLVSYSSITFILSGIRKNMVLVVSNKNLKDYTVYRVDNLEISAVEVSRGRSSGMTNASNGNLSVKELSPSAPSIREH